ncbi:MULTISPECIES: autotransporter-associated beta strand repeat-containing protein [Paracoccus]|uniref:autotransporter-associated beta strand repeat-containing protein n=1 Tax=Paracoccus TaxID=265 RepID=UPI001FB6D82E|nr:MULTISPECIES: autotransporter-associated beta strand repeat-containing protein [Paracoccus]MCJ1901414.1 autotransporter-associated beta strand repeat-containing protein [Paracoccus versutus]MDF3905942.1 autotransporter-associated beta strand repeat-containing protein [Paracoccus sp. AS002]
MGNGSSGHGRAYASRGSLRAGAAGSFATLGAHAVDAGASLDLDGFDQTIGSLSGAGDVTLGQGTLTTGGDGSDTGFGGTISGTGGLVKEGGGTLILSGTNTHSGDILVAGGVLQLGSGSIGTLMIAGDMELGTGSVLGFDLGASGPASGGGTSDHVAVGGQLTLDGVLRLSNAGGAGLGYYRLLSYGGLTDHGLGIATTPALGTSTYEIVTGGGHVDLVVGTAAMRR